MKKRISLFIACITALTSLSQEISYGEYMNRVMEGNISLAARKLDIEIAEAGVKASKVHNDPTLAITYSNSEDWSKKLGQGIEVELSRSFTFGVRRSRIDVADSERKQTVALFEEYMRNFRADATIAYLAHLRSSKLLQEAKAIYNELSGVAHSDSIRFIKGEIAESDWLESRMAQGIARNGMLDAEALHANTAITLGYYMGNLEGAELLRAQGTLEISEKAAPIEQYTTAALAHRADLLVALSNAETAKAIQQFNRATRRPELDIKIGATYNIARPDFTTLMAGVAVPLKISNFNKGARILDEINVRQTEIAIEDARLLVEADVMQAYSNYGYASMQAGTFSNKTLGDMRKVVEGKKRAYELGEISFIEYIVAERNESEMRREYIDALYNKAVAWVELQRATGFSLEFGTSPITE